MDAVSARAVADQRRRGGEPEPFGRIARSTNVSRGGRTTMPAIPSCWLGATAARCVARGG